VNLHPPNVSRTPHPRPKRRTVNVVPIEGGKELRTARKRLYTWKELRELPPPEWLIEGVLPKGGLCLLFGATNVGKTFLALNWALERALAGDLVVYIAGEGKPGIPSRVRAWLTERGLQDSSLENFLVHDGPVDMLSEKAVKAFIEGLGDRIPALIVLDTLARCFGGWDENLAKDMGRFILNCDKMREAFSGSTVLVLHHTGKDERKGARGSSALNAAADCVIELKEDGASLTLQCEKMKDAERFTSRTLQLAPRHGSCIVAWTAKGTPPASKMPKTARKALDLLNGEALTLEVWRQCFYAACNGKQDAKRQAFKRAKDQLKSRGLIRIEGDKVSRTA
jgi:hypothetical protein